MDSFRKLGALALVTLSLAACGPRPVGDFGRARPSWTHDTAMPAVGKVIAGQSEPVSDFNQTDQEEEMHDRVWRFLVAPHSKDWFYDTAVELQRTRITGATDLQFEVDRYHRWLRGTPYESSRTRYATVGRHIAADLDTVPATFAAICAVIEVDRQRAIALRSLSGLDPDAAANVAARRYENEAHIAWFVRALDYRYQSYDYALDNLLVETPHEQSIAVDDALRRIGAFVARARRGDFCTGAATGVWSGHEVVIPSRYSHEGDTEVVLPKEIESYRISDNFTLVPYVLYRTQRKILPC